MVVEDSCRRSGLRYGCCSVPIRWAYWILRPAGWSWKVCPKTSHLDFALAAFVEVAAGHFDHTEALVERLRSPHTRGRPELLDIGEADKAGPQASSSVQSWVLGSSVHVETSESISVDALLGVAVVLGRTRRCRAQSDPIALDAAAQPSARCVVSCRTRTRECRLSSRLVLGTLSLLHVRCPEFSAWIVLGEK